MASRYSLKKGKKKRKREKEKAMKAASLKIRNGIMRGKIKDQREESLRSPPPTASALPLLRFSCIFISCTHRADVANVL